MSKQRWSEVKSSLPVGAHVRGVVVRVAPFGVFVQLDSTDVVAVLLVTHFEDGGRGRELAEYPQVGERIEAVVVAHADHNEQVRLSTRASDR